MGKMIVIALIAFLAFAWYKGWVGEWVGQAADSGAAAVKQTQKNATKTRPAEPEEKK
jgi:hypothetical protein